MTSYIQKVLRLRQSHIELKPNWPVKAFGFQSDPELSLNSKLSTVKNLASTSDATRKA